MFVLTENARAALDAHFAENKKEPIRMYLAPGGCSGPRIGLAIDDPNEEDFVVEQDGYTFCCVKQLWQTIGEGVTVDAGPMGFIVTPAIPFPSSGGCGCSHCGTGTCGGSCH